MIEGLVADTEFEINSPSQMANIVPAVTDHNCPGGQPAWPEQAEIMITKPNPAWLAI
jgi:hypothetical protein